MGCTLVIDTSFGSTVGIVGARTVPSEPGERGEEAGRSVEAAVLSAGTSAPYAADAEQSATEWIPMRLWPCAMTSSAA